MQGQLTNRGGLSELLLLGLCPGRAAECPCQLTSRLPGERRIVQPNADDVIFILAFQEEATQLEGVVQGPGEDKKAYLSSPSYFMLPVPRQFTSKIPLGPTPEKRMPAQLIDCFAPKAVLFWWFLPNFLTYSSLSPVSWFPEAPSLPSPPGDPSRKGSDNFESPSGKSAVPRQSES